MNNSVKWLINNPSVPFFLHSRYYSGCHVNTDYHAHVANNNDSRRSTGNKGWDSYKRQHANTIFNVGYWRIIIIVDDESWSIIVTV